MDLQPFLQKGPYFPSLSFKSHCYGVQGKKKQKLSHSPNVDRPKSYVEVLAIVVIKNQYGGLKSEGSVNKSRGCNFDFSHSLTALSSFLSLAAKTSP